MAIERLKRFIYEQARRDAAQDAALAAGGGGGSGSGDGGDYNIERMEASLLPAFPEDENTYVLKFVAGVPTWVQE